MLDDIGLNSIHARLSIYKYLSEGEKYRVMVGRLLKNALCDKNINPDTDYVILDEFTSVLDRDSARCVSCSLSKCIRNYTKTNNKNKFEKPCKIILSGAHSDIIPYLQPDLIIKLTNNNHSKIHFYLNPKNYQFWPNIDAKAIVCNICILC